jgi:predicted ester cyclase
MKYVKLASAVLTLALLGMATARAQTSGTAGAPDSAATQAARAQSVPDQAVQAVPQATPAQGSAPAQAKPAPTAPENHPVDWAPRQYVDLWNTGEFAPEHLNAIFNNTTIMHSNNGERILLSPIMVAQVVSAWRKSMPDLQFTIEDAIIQVDKVVLRVSFTGTYTKSLFPNTEDPASFARPRKIHSTGIFIFSVKDGKIGELWESYNEPRMRATMGSSWCAPEERKPWAPTPAPAPAPGGKP